jgi:hypothetical protein
MNECLVFPRKLMVWCFFMQPVLHFCRDGAIYSSQDLSIRHFSVRGADNPLLKPVEMRFRDDEVHVVQNEKTKFSIFAVLRP